jgi:hypothetical protein
MADDNPGAADPQAGTTTQPQAGTSSSGQAPGAQTAQAASAAAASGTGTADQSAAVISERDEARREAATLRTKLRELERAAEAKAKADQTDQERIAALEKRLAEADAREREFSIGTAITTAANRMGFRNPELAGPLVRPQIQLDDDGKPKNLDTLLKGLLQRDPYLAKASPDFGGGNRGAGKPGDENATMNALIRRAAGRAD